MIGKIEKTPQLEIFKIPLVRFIQENHELCLLSKKVDWDSLEEDLSIYYTLDNGRPSIPIRKVAGVLLLRRMFMPVMKELLRYGKKIPIGNSSVEKFIFNMKLPLIQQSLLSSEKE